MPKPSLTCRRAARVSTALSLLAAMALASVACRRDPVPPRVESISSPRELTAEPIEEDFAAGARHSYRVELAAGEVVRVVAEQCGADLALAVIDPAGERGIRVDRPIGTTGAERVTILAETSGSYTLEVQDAGAAGRYLLRIVDGPRPAAPGDRLAAAAERAFYAARTSEKAGTPEGLAAGAKGYEEALRLWSEAGDRHGRAIAGAALGTMLSSLGQPARAVDELESALPLLVDEGELSTAAEVHNTLGALLRAAGRFDEAVDHYHRAQALAGPGGNESARYRALHNLGVLEIYRGRIDEALDSLARARAGWQRLDWPEEEARTLLRIGDAYLEAGEFDLAETPLQEAHDLASRNRSRRYAASALAQLASVALLREDRSRAEELLRRAIPVLTEENLHHELARARNDLGLLHRQEGRFEQALAEFEQAAALFTAPRDVAMMRMHTARTLEGMGQAERALPIYRELLAEFGRLEEADLEASVHYGWARVELALDRLNEALEHVETAIAQVERRIARFDDRSLGTAYAARKDDYYALQIEILMCLHERDPAGGYDVRAVIASESRRARQLLASLTASPEGGAPIIDLSLAAEREDLVRRIQGLESALDDAGFAADGGSLVLARELRLLHAQAERLEARIAAAEPRYAALVAPPRFDLARFQAQLDADTEILVVALGERRSWLWRITRDRLESHALAARETLNELAAHSHRLLARSHERRAYGATERTLVQLGQALLQPVGADLAGERLVIVPDGALHYIPWGALPAPTANPAPAAPLIERFEVVGLPSLAVLDELRRRSAGRPVPPGLLAVIADPVTENSDPRLPAVARRSPALDPPVLPEDLAALAAGLDLREFPRLPYAQTEAEAILGLVPAEARWSALGFQAHREAMFDRLLGRYRYLHFAVHVVSSETRPHLSGLVLSRYRPDGGRRDALLRFGDLFRLDLPVDLVVLSGCRSGGGKHVRGEGIVGLTRGFMAAGAPRVVVSLWDVNDRATAELMTAFYRGLLERGLPPAAALRAAQRELRARPDRSAPYYWAGFVLQGDWR